MRIQRRRCRRKVEYLVFGANKSTPDDHDEMRLSTSATQFRVWFRNESIFLLIIDPSKNISPFSSTRYLRLGLKVSSITDFNSLTCYPFRYSTGLATLLLGDSTNLARFKCLRLQVPKIYEGLQINSP